MSTSVHQGTLGGRSLTEEGNSGFLFSKKALTPSVWSLCNVSSGNHTIPADQTYGPPNIWEITLESSKCAPSAESAPRHINDRLRCDANGLTF